MTFLSKRSCDAATAREKSDTGITCFNFGCCQCTICLRVRNWSLILETNLQLTYSSFTVGLEKLTSVSLPKSDGY